MKRSASHTDKRPGIRRFCTIHGQPGQAILRRSFRRCEFPQLAKDFHRLDRFPLYHHIIPSFPQFWPSIKGHLSVADVSL